MFDHTQYVPILRFKESERLALKGLFIEDRLKVTPLFELSPNLIEQNTTNGAGKNASTQKAICRDTIFSKVVQDILACWGRLPFFVDYELIERLIPFTKKDHPVNSLCRAAIAENLPMVLVTGLNRPSAYQMAVKDYCKKTNIGLCLRLTVEDLRNEQLETEIQNLLSYFDIEYRHVDLLVDLKLILQNAVKYQEIVERVPQIMSWRTFTVASGAFPKDLSDLEKNQQHEVSRSDWQHWFKQISEFGIKRMPAFSDYTIQHPIYDFNPVQNPNISASIRYTSDNYWVIMRGEGLRNDNSSGYAQYWANAQLLTERDEFCGRDYSKGDEYISYIASQIQITGNPRTWLRAGINHHIVYTVRQLATTFGTSNNPVPKDAVTLGPQPGRGASKRRHAASSETPQPSLFSLEG
jgi:hypothetical protein